MSSRFMFARSVYKKLIKGRSRYKAARRYEIALNILFICSLIGCLGSAAYTALASSFMADELLQRIALYTTCLILLWWLSRAGRHTLTAFALFVCSCAAIANTILTPRFGLPLFEVAVALTLLLGGMVLELKLTRAALAAERDLLECRVIERTKQLEETQLRRTLELQRFAEFGRLSAHLLHEVSNPLTVASLHLEQADHKSSTAIRQARRSLHQLERYVSSARKQLQLESEAKNFGVRQEMKQLLRILKPIALKAHTRLEVSMPEEVILYGDPVRFNQIVANLVSNAIDSYTAVPLSKVDRIVYVRLKQSTRFLQLEVEDAGIGISPEAMPQIFEPFYSTKAEKSRGLGIGLAIVKQTVRDDFYGTICANSSAGRGTKFTALLRLAPPVQADESREKPMPSTRLLRTAP